MPDRYSCPKHSHNGIITSTPIEGGPPVVRDIIICCHCERRTVFTSLSKTRPEWCPNCAAYHCNQPHCLALQRLSQQVYGHNGCCNWRQEFENMEADRSIEAGHVPYWRPIVGRVEAEVPRR